MSVAVPPESARPGVPSPLAGLLARLADSRAALAGLGVAAVAAVVLVPVLAIPLAWPFLFVIPGWIVVGRVAPALTAAGRAGVAVVTSIYLSAHLTNLVATVSGEYARPAVLVTYGLLVGSSGVVAWRWWRVTYDASFTPAPWPEVPRAAFALAGVAALWVGGVLGLSIWHLTSAGWVSGGWNWSDLLVHVSIANSLNAGNFPPQVPYFAGVPLTYHWFADFHAALTALVAGVDTIPVMAFSSAVATGALVLLTWELAWVLLRDRRAAAIAAGIMVFTGGMGWLRLPCDLAGVIGAEDCDLVGSLVALPGNLLAGRVDPVGLIAHNPYDNRWLTGWPYFRIPSVMGTGLLTHRATTLGLPGLVAVVLLVQVSLGKRPAGMWLAGLLAAALAPFQFFAFPAAYLLVLLQVVAARFWTMPNWPADAVRFLAPGLLAIPFALPAFNQVGGAGHLQLVAGWGEAPLRDGPLAVAFFYLTNLGVPFALALVAVFARRVPRGGLLAAWLVAMFIIPNVALFTPIVFDMNKYFQMMWLAVALLAASLVRDWSARWLAATAVPSILAAVLVSVWFIGSDWVVLSVSGERAAAWIRANTPERAVFVTEANINSPVDLAGRLRLTTFWAHVAQLGYDTGPRADDVKRIACEGDATAEELMRSYGATYVLASGGRLADCPAEAPGTDFDASPRFERVFAQGEVRIWQLVHGAAGT